MSRRRLLPGRSSDPRRSEAGYNLVMLMVIITVLNIAIAAALPVWSTMMKREREEELIFRGLQYAEAIRLFQQRFGRLPVRLEELIEVEPRCIRQLWKDPMTDSLDWGLVVATPRRGRATPGQPAGVPGQDLAPPQGEQPGEAQGASPQLPQGPIVGVYSRSTDEALKVFFGRDRYDQWQFTLELISQGGLTPGNPAAQQGHVNAAVTQHPRLNIRWLGRPFRQGLEAPVAGAPPGGSGLPPSALMVEPAGKGR